MIKNMDGRGVDLQIKHDHSSEGFYRMRKTNLHKEGTRPHKTACAPPGKIAPLDTKHTTDNGKDLL